MQLALLEPMEIKKHYNVKIVMKIVKDVLDQMKTNVPHVNSEDSYLEHNV